MNAYFNSKDKQKRIDDFVDKPNLPPIDGDDSSPRDNPDYSQFLEQHFDEEEPASAALEDDDMPGFDEVSFADKLLADEELPPEEEATPGGLEGFEGVDEEESTDWVDDTNEESTALEDSWFVDDIEKNSLEEKTSDRGKDGPLEDSFEIDRHQWDDLTKEEDEEGSIPDAMDHLGLHLSMNTGDDPRAEVDLQEVIETSYLGPREGRISAAWAADGGLLAVGDGIYSLGADGMLHRISSSSLLAELNATTICGRESMLVVGTEVGGALTTEDRGKSFRSINGWYGLGLDNPRTGSSEHISTTFQVLGQPVSDGFRLWGLTGEGQLFSSSDHGTSWQGPLTNSRCLAVAPVAGTNLVFVLVARGSRAELLRRNEDDNWEQIELPATLALTAARGPVQLKAGGDTIVVAVEDPLVPLCLSLNQGRSWREVESLRGVTAVTVDPTSTGWLAAAVHQAVSDRGVVRVTADGGHSWKTALVTGEQGEEIDRSFSNDEEPLGRILDLATDVGRTRRLIAATAGGVYIAVLALRGVTH